MPDEPPDLTVIDLAKERAARSAAMKTTLDGALATLRALPVPERGEALIQIFSMVVAEFSRMVLDHVPDPTPDTKERATDMIDKSDAIRSCTP
jgi:hypothetical protein